MHKRYEYDVVDFIPPPNLDLRLSERGKEGWRVVAMIGKDEDGDMTFLLEREVPDDQTQR